MATPLKELFGADLPEKLADAFAPHAPDFNRATFLRDARRGYADLAFMARGGHLADALARQLPADFNDAARIIHASLGPPLPDRDGDHGLGPFFYHAHTVFVERHGIDHPDTALDLLRELTRRFTGEFSIRAFLVRHPEITLARLHRWVDDPSPHVRRLASEGSRPRLPWACRLPEFIREPEPTLALLERLRDDPHPYVRRSVANHLNDIAKDHPERVLDLARRWAVDAPAERRALLRHALRTLVKEGRPEALALLGADTDTTFETTAPEITPARTRIGESVRLSWTVRNPGDSAATVVTDFRIHFARPEGKASAKVFKGTVITLAPGESRRVEKTFSLAPRTTRKLHPGEHRVDALVNGMTVPLGSFLLDDADA